MREALLTECYDELACCAGLCVQLHCERRLGPSQPLSTNPYSSIQENILSELRDSKVDRMGYLQVSDDQHSHSRKRLCAAREIPGICASTSEAL